MAFVHGHLRDTTWVVAHWRRPQDPEEGQLGLDLDPGVPAPRTPVQDEAPQDLGTAASRS